MRIPLSTAVLCTLALLGTARPATANVKLNPLFTDHMVLQQGMKVAVWGTADPGEKVAVNLDKQVQTTVAGPDGKWLVHLENLPVGGPFQLKAVGKNTVTVKDVLVGEVWFCSGQSNMEFTVSNAKKKWAGTVDAAKEIAAANHPQIRMFTVKQTLKDSPQSAVQGVWEVCSPKTVGEFSAVAYFFGRQLQQNLQVPVGLVNSSYGASTAQAWVSRKALELEPKFKALPDKTGTARPQHQACVLYNGMVAPVAPYAIRGALWYQGESITTQGQYGLLMTTLIKDWRKLWGQGDFPFLFVQLPNYKEPAKQPGGNGGWAGVREEQASALALPNTGMAVTIDIGEEKDVHPHNKQEFGKRLALIAEAQVYARKVVAHGPVFDSMKIDGNAARINFKHTDGGLTAKGGKVAGFAIAGKDKKFVWADAKIEGDTVVLTSAQVPQPTIVRYAWADNPPATLFNGAGLPARPFRADGPALGKAVD